MVDATKYPHLAEITNPLELQAYSEAELTALAEECRTFLMDTIGRTGGHHGAALGVVELTLALFNQFDFLRDRIAWDVGHQGHVYKMLTGRASRFGQYGQWGGLCKFLERRESPFDHMGAGHASTSVSAALGMAVARDVRGEDHHSIAVIGDGALTGGLAYEALNLAGHMDVNLLVILNDNGMSIDENVGGMNRMLRNAVTHITSSDSYNAIREDIKWVGRHVPFGGGFLKSLKHMERSVKDYASPDTAGLFESLGFRYFGPIDGHDVGELVAMLQHAKTMRGPVLLHVATVKGKGLGPEIENTFEAHALSPKKAKAPDAPPRKSWTKIYTEGLTELMGEDPKVVALSAAMLTNAGLAGLQQEYPERVIDVGIAEQNAYCSAAGMAIGGLKPFVTVYSTFSQRAFDQMVHDIALQQLPVRLMLDRGGFVGQDGPTHHGVLDYSYLRLIPGFVHMAPRDEREMRRMMLTAHAYEDGPIAMRYPRGDTPAMTWDEPLTAVPIGKGELLRKASKPGLLLVAVGSMVATALTVAETLEAEDVPCAVVDARFVKPLDEDLLAQQIGRAKAVLTLEENVTNGGFGEGVLHLMADQQLLVPCKVLGAPDRFISFGSPADQLRECGLLPEQVADTARTLWAQVTEGAEARDAGRKRLA